VPLGDTPYHMYGLPLAISLQEKHTRAFRKTRIVFDEYSALHTFNDFSRAKLVAGKFIVAVFRDSKLIGAYEVLDLRECADQ